MHLTRPIFLALIWWISSLTTVQGGELISATVDHRNRRLILRSAVLVETPVTQVRAILTDFENLPQVNPGLKKVEILEYPASSQVRMRVISEVCILIFCLDYTWVQEVRTLPCGDIVAVIDPEQGDFRQGQAHWRLLPKNGHTRLLFEADLVPKFWFPPALGPWLIERKLENEALETALNIERLLAAHQ